MVGTVPRTEPATGPTSLKRWSDLPAGPQALVVKKLSFSEVARIASVSTHFDQVSQQDPRWVELLQGRNKSVPSPARPRRAVGALLASCGRGQKRIRSGSVKAQ